jgi:nicotinamidase-related amidase
MQSPVDKYRLLKSHTGMLIVDVQEKLCAAMEAGALERMVQRTRAAIQGAQALSLPIVYTEQYPKGLGPTISALSGLLEKARRVEKLSFSCALPEVVSALKCNQILIAGMEAHVCVFQTARDLAQQGLRPYLMVDAVLSRSEEDRQVGIALCREVGAVVTTVESALFDLLGKAGSPEFKLVSTAVK